MPLMLIILKNLRNVKYLITLMLVLKLTKSVKILDQLDLEDNSERMGLITFLLKNV